MKFLSFFTSLTLVLSSTCVYLPNYAFAASVDVEVRQLQKEKAALEKKYYEASLVKTKMENKQRMDRRKWNPETSKWKAAMFKATLPAPPGRSVI